MQVPRVKLAQLFAVYPIAVGLIGACRWIFGPASFGQVFFGFVELGMVAPVLLIIAGATCFWLGRQCAFPIHPVVLAVRSDRVGLWMTSAACLTMGVSAGLMLLEHVTGRSFGIDVHALGAIPTLQTPSPGRMSPNACIGFLFLSLGLWGLQRPTATASKPWAAFAVVVTALIGIAGLLGAVLDLEEAYRFVGANRLSTQVASSFIALTLSLWWTSEGRRDFSSSLSTHERQITTRSVVVLTLLVVASGAGGFAVVRSAYTKAQADHLALTADVNGEAIVYSLKMARWISNTASTRPSVTQTLARLNQSPGDAQAQSFLKKVGDSFITAGLDAMTLETAGGTSVSAGHPLLKGNEPSVPLDGLFAGSQLAYAGGGLVLSTQLSVYEQGAIVGRLRSEQRLALFDKLLKKLRDASESTDVLICARSSNDAICLPSRFYRDLFRIPMFDAVGNPTKPANRALLGQTGTLKTPDLRGVQVIAAYQPLGDTGLGMVVKTNVDTFYGGLRGRLAELAALLAFFVALGTWAMRNQIRPLVSQLASEQRRSAAILEQSNDAFVSLDSSGHVNGWNAQAVRVLGWSVAEATGRRLAELIIPAENRDAHEKGFAHFTRTGQGAVVNRRIELMAQHRDGRLIPVELSVASTDMGDHFVATAFLRDISERRRAEQALKQSEQRLRLIADNMPALISYMDRDYRYTFVNAHYRDWFSISDDIVGKTVLEVFGDEAFAGVRTRLDEAFAGADVVFELTNPIPGAPVHMLVHYLPDRDSDGNVVGLYGLIIDRSEQHLANERLEASERQLRTVTDNLPVLMTYFDSDERIRFLNRAFHDWLGLDVAASLGRTLLDVVGTEHYEKRREYVKTALRGERVEFEVVSQTLGGVRNLQTVYILTSAKTEACGVFFRSALM